MFPHIQFTFFLRDIVTLNRFKTTIKNGTDFNTFDKMNLKKANFIIRKGSFIVNTVKIITVKMVTSYN